MYVFDGANGALLSTLIPPRPIADGFFGWEVGFGPVGDVNDDGREDLVVSNANSAPEGQSRRVYCVDALTGELFFSLGPPNPQATSGPFGSSTSRVQDVNGDGVDDYVVGDYDYTKPTGRIYIFDGVSREVIRTIHPNSLGLMNAPFRNGQATPDVNGDGSGDVFIASSRAEVVTATGRYSNAGRGFVISGATGELLYSMEAPDPQTDARLGLANAICRDLTGDGIPDFILASFFIQRAYVFSGADGRWLTTLSSGGPLSMKSFGREARSLPDLNGGGLAEFLVGGGHGAYLFDGENGMVIGSVQSFGMFNGEVAPGTYSWVSKAGGNQAHAYIIGQPRVGDSGRVYLTPFTPPSAVVRLKALGRSENGFKLSIRGEPGTRYELLSTADFENWSALSTVTAGEAPTEYEDRSDSGLTRRFYQLRHEQGAAQ